MGYILLGEIVENISGQKLNELYAEIISTPLGLNNTLMFRPVDEYTSSIISDIAATQYCPWRKKLLQGEVDDEHCWLLNGIAGHAGLFGTIHGVMDMCIHILNQWKEREKTPAYKNSLLKKALKKVHKNSTWCLGFDTPSAVGSSGGRYLSKESVGHLGFTGTSFWIDPQKDIIVTLLTNRIHPTRENEKIKKFRPLLHDLVFQLIETN